MEGLADRIIESIQKEVDLDPYRRVSENIAYAAGALSYWKEEKPGAQIDLEEVVELLRYLGGIPEGEMK